MAISVEEEEGLLRGIAQSPQPEPKVTNKDTTGKSFLPPLAVRRGD
jgi:hypothetical protein